MLQLPYHTLNGNRSLLLFHLDRRTLQVDQNAITLVEHLHCQLVIQLADLVSELEGQVDRLLVLRQLKLFALHGLHHDG